MITSSVVLLSLLRADVYQIECRNGNLFGLNANTGLDNAGEDIDPCAVQGHLDYFVLVLQSRQRRIRTIQDQI